MFGISDCRFIGVDALEDGVDELGFVQFLDSIDNESPAANHTTSANKEDLHRCFEFIPVSANDVVVVGACTDHLLFLDRLAYRTQLVTQPRRIFELIGLCSVVHPLLEIGNHRVGISVQERHEI